MKPRYLLTIALFLVGVLVIGATISGLIFFMSESSIDIFFWFSAFFGILFFLSLRYINLLSIKIDDRRFSFDFAVFQFLCWLRIREVNIATVERPIQLWLIVLDIILIFAFCVGLTVLLFALFPTVVNLPNVVGVLAGITGIIVFIAAIYSYLRSK